MTTNVVTAGRTSAELELHALLETAVDAVVIIDAGGRIEQCNSAAERMFGWGHGELIGKDVTVLMPEPHRTRHASYVERYLRTGEPHIIGIGREVGAQRKDGTVFPIRLSVGELRTAQSHRFVAFLHDLTARKQIETDLIEAHRRTQSYLDLAEVILLALDPDGRVTMINRKGCEIVGCTEADLTGVDWIATFVPPAAATEVRRAFDRFVGENGTGEYAYTETPILAQGRERVIAWRNRLLRDSEGNTVGVLCSGEDVTERRLVERALKRSQRLLRAAERVAGVGDFEVQIPGAGTDQLSPVVRQILGLGETETPRPDAFTAYVHPDDRERFDAALAEIREAGETFDQRYRIVTPAGDVRFVHAIARARRDGGVLTLTGMLHDVTERTLAEEEAQRTRERLMHVSRISTLGEMASGLAHEINQPLTAISIFAQACARMLDRGEEALPDLREALEQISAQAIRAGEVIRRLRELVKQRGTRRTTVDCNMLVRDLITLAEPDARTDDIVLRVDLAPGPLPVHVDVVQIQQVLLNLIRNAIDATLAGTASQRRIEIGTARTGDDEVEIAVADFGVGLPAGGAEHLFEPFFTTKAAGTGLGLSISRGIVRAHGGRLEAVTNASGGATFRFTLPLTHEDDT